MKRNLKYTIVSLVFWVALVCFFDHPLIWKITAIAFCLFSISVVITFSHHKKLANSYGIKPSIAFENLSLLFWYLLPLLGVFICVTIYQGTSNISIPNWKDAVLTIVIGFWITWLECAILSNAFIEQIIQDIDKSNMNIPQY